MSELAPEPLPLPNHNPKLEIRHHPIKGRGVFALQPLPSSTLVDVSPVLLFSHPEYAEHGRHTLLDYYTYRWPGGFALALGLGSIFNHSRRPNVGFVRDTERGVIRYLTTKEIEPGEELCISYGDHLWFEDVNEDEEGMQGKRANDSEPEPEDNVFAKIMLSDEDVSDRD
ncbi:hypothetical protein BC937DRAFT_95686 [Endogone sp. FLAS-F59071]|nr:hypothetical protein BC937DRAFT_95686 [Endogone sp. FLAS-F59071]|eukprot:RUS13199.1 hypothetical protein BC937DRAFT_95686 [Endogone sp. FLAS-F59071]